MLIIGTAVFLARVHVQADKQAPTDIAEATTAFSDTRDPLWDFILVAMGNKP